MSFSEVPLIILYRSGTVVGVTECVWSGIRALSSSQNTTKLLADACHEERECIVGTIRSSFLSNPAVPPMSTVNTALYFDRQ